MVDPSRAMVECSTAMVEGSTAEWNQVDPSSSVLESSRVT